VGASDQMVDNGIGDTGDERIDRSRVAEQGTGEVGDERTDAGGSAAIREFHRQVGAASGVDLPLELPDGEVLGPQEAAYRIRLAHPWSLRTMLWPPNDLSAGEAYVRGDIDISGDVTAMFRDAERLSERLPRASGYRAGVVSAFLAMPRPPRDTAADGGAPEDGARKVGRARLRGRRHSQERDRAAIAYHYDRPPGFYEAFLDEDLTYSCAYFADAGEDIGTAQRRKLDLVCRKLRLSEGDRVLDIGCGYGSLLAHAAEHYGAIGVGVTLSEVQVEQGRERLKAAGLDDRVELRLADYRDVGERFDAVASVGMVEHVGPKNLDAYFSDVRQLLRPGGLFCCHGIVLGDADAVRDGSKANFVDSYVFPDGGLVPAWRMTRHCERAGFQLIDVHQLRPHYALTLRNWVSRLEANAEQAIAAAGEESYRVWRLYMSGSAYSFETHSLGVVQVLGRAPGGSDELPLGREWMRPFD